MSFLLLTSQTLIAAPSAGYATTQDPPVRVWFSSSGNYASGDRAKVYAKSLEDGYLIVLRADAAGRVRVLFPLDPREDQRIAGGKKYELKSRAGREAFVAADAEHGTVLAAVASAPFRVEQFVENGRWDSAALSGDGVRDDPEAALIDLVGRMMGEERFDYAVASYVVSQQYARSVRYAYTGLTWGYDPFWSYSRFRFGFPRRIIVYRRAPVRGQ